jgi:S-adenosylmethionine-diacylgycerolhomoserine-N-methlytransferase
MPVEMPLEQRTHSALMDQIYRRQRHVYDFSRKFYLLGRDRLIAELHAKPDEQVIELGCGTARNLIRIAEAYHNTKLYGFDASQEMLRTAKRAVVRAGLSHRIALMHGLAEQVPRHFAPEVRFDHAIFSYSLSMIPDWRGALVAAAKIVRPQGTIHIVDFGDMKTLWPPAARSLRAWLRLFQVTPRDELLSGVEQQQNAGQIRAHCLAGRYAFVLKASPSAIINLVR